MPPRHRGLPNTSLHGELYPRPPAASINRPREVLNGAGAVAKADDGEDEHAELVNALAEDFEGDEEEDDEE